MTMQKCAVLHPALTGWRRNSACREPGAGFGACWVPSAKVMSVMRALLRTASGFGWTANSRRHGSNYFFESENFKIPPELSEPFSEDLLKANRLDGRETSEDLWQEKK